MNLNLSIKIVGWLLIACGGAGLIFMILATYIYEYYNPYPIFGAVVMIFVGWLLLRLRKKHEPPELEQEPLEYEEPKHEIHEHFAARRRIVLIALTSFTLIILAAIILYAAPIMKVTWTEPYTNGDTNGHGEVEKTDRVTIYEYLKDWR